jgi:hypothetical protein
MYLYLNINNIIIDIVDDVKPVMKNTNGIIIPCYIDKAQGYMGNNEKIYAKVGVNFVQQFEDIMSVVGVEEVPEYVVPRVYKYENGEFVEADNYELSTSALTSASIQERANIDYIAMETGVDL